MDTFDRWAEQMLREAGIGFSINEAKGVAAYLRRELGVSGGLYSTLEAVKTLCELDADDGALALEAVRDIRAVVSNKLAQVL